MSGDFIFREVVGVKFVIQRVLHASVTIDGVRIAQIGKGFLVLVGIGREDTAADADRLADKLVKLRIFEDESGKTNRSLSDVNGSLLLVSQFTLYADCRKGNRPSFGAAGAQRMLRGCSTISRHAAARPSRIPRRGASAPRCRWSF